MGSQELSKYQEILSNGFPGGVATFPAFTDLGDDSLAMLARHPDANLELDGAVLIVNSRLMTDEMFRQRFKFQIHQLNECITDDMDAAGLDLVSLAIAYFVVAVDTGHIDPEVAPLSREVNLSGMTGWAADMISCRVYSRYIDRVKISRLKARERGSLQHPGTMPEA